MEYQPFDPNVEVLGRNIKALIAGTGNEILKALQHHDITDIQDDQWYPQSAVLAALQEFGETANMVSVGTQVIKHTVFPPDVDSIEKALMAIDIAYHMNHRNGDVGYYRAEMQGPRHIVMECKNPYPCDFDYGLIYGVARRFLPADGDLVVEHAPGDCRKDGTDVCIYHVTW